MASLETILVDSSKQASDEISTNGTMPPGSNGPWENPQTPVRNTGHWLITFIHSHRITEEEKYLTAAESAIAYITSEEARPRGETFYHLREHEKSRCNGLIGQAWTIEALVTAAEYFDRPELITLAEEVFLLHPFDEGLSAWKYVDIDGEFRSLDKTFNHQLWFAMAGALLSDHPETSPLVEEQVRRFLEELPDNLNLYRSGLIYHPFKPEFDVRKYAKIFAEGVRSGVAHKMISNVAQAIVGGEEGDPMKETSIGYHSFNMYAFAVLNECFPDHPFWDHEKFERALAYARSERFKDQLDENPYGYPYNCTGIEMAYVLDVFADDVRDLQRWWLEEQLERTFDPETMTMSRNNPDPATLTARLYEATRLPDIELPLEIDTDDDDR